MTAPTRGGKSSAGRESSKTRTDRTEEDRVDTRKPSSSRTNRRVRTRSGAGERTHTRRGERGQRARVVEPQRKERRSTKQGGEPRRETERRRVDQARPKRGTGTSRGSGSAADHRVSREAVRSKIDSITIPTAWVKALRLPERLSISRAPFVVAVMAVLAIGIVGTLWLSIAAVSNSYQLQDSNAKVNALAERKEKLLRQVSEMSSVPEVQRRAEELGMVPGPRPAYLVARPDGSVRVVGEPSEAKAPQKPRGDGGRGVDANRGQDAPQAGNARQGEARNEARNTAASSRGNEQATDSRPSGHTPGDQADSQVE